MNCLLIKSTSAFSSQNFRGSVSETNGFSPRLSLSSSSNENSSSAKSQKEIWFPLAVNLERSPCQLVIVKSRSRSLMRSSQDFCGSVVFKAEKRASVYWERFWFLITGKIFLWLKVFWFEVFEPVFFAIKIAVYK